MAPNVQPNKAETEHVHLLATNCNASRANRIRDWGTAHEMVGMMAMGMVMQQVVAAPTTGTECGGSRDRFAQGPGNT